MIYAKVNVSKVKNNNLKNVKFWKVYIIFCCRRSALVMESVCVVAVSVGRVSGENFVTSVL